MIQKIKIILWSDIFIKKVIAYVILIAILFAAKDFLMMFLITFLFAYLIFSMWKYLSDKLKTKFINIKYKKIINKFIWINAMITYIYLFIIIWTIIFISHIVPILTTELNNFSKHIPIIADYTKDITTNLSELKNTNEIVSSDVEKMINEKNMWILLNTIDHLKKVWWWLITFFISFVLSFFFIIDRKRLYKYLEWIKKSSLKFLYEEYRFLFSKIAKGFLLIFKAQFKIAIANTILTYTWLFIIGLSIWEHIPYMWIIITTVFLLSFVPILWVFISSIPITLIMYNLIGVKWVIYILVMVLFIHSVEAYILNPKLVSEAVELPVSLTFLILIVWEHLFWAIWLIISVPIFYIFIEVLWNLDADLRSKLEKKTNK